MFLNHNSPFDTLVFSLSEEKTEVKTAAARPMMKVIVSNEDDVKTDGATKDGSNESDAAKNDGSNENDAAKKDGSDEKDVANKDGSDNQGDSESNESKKE